MAQGPLDHELDRVHVVGLGDVVVGAAADGIDRAVHVAERGDEEHRRLDSVLDHPVEDLQPVGLDHADVAHHRVESVAAAGTLLGEHPQRFRAIGRHGDLMPVLGEDLLHQAARGGIVVDDQDSRRLRHGSDLIRPSRRGSVR